MMPKHVFEKQPDVVAFKFNPPVSLGAYTLKDLDPNGNWYLWQRREDWKRTSVAKFGEPGPSTPCISPLARAKPRSSPRPTKGTGRDPRHRAGRHDHAGEDQPDLQRLVQVVPVG